jgi:ankyrin repeat protein
MSWKDKYPIHCAAQLGDVSQLEQFLRAQDNDLAAKLSSLDEDGWACLHYSAWYGHIDAVRFLLKSGANPDIQNEQVCSWWFRIACLTEELMKLLSDMSVSVVVALIIHTSCHPLLLLSPLGTE